MRHRHVIPALLTGLILASAGIAAAQIDPERRTNLEIGLDGPLRGNGSLDGYGFLLINRPHFVEEDLYLRVVVSPVYAISDLVRDRWPAEGHALGVGLGGGLFANNYSEFRDGDYKRGESFWGHGAAGNLSYYWRQLKIAGIVPVEGQLSLQPQYAIYDEGPDTERVFRLPPDSAIYSLRGGLRAGGVPPELFPKTTLEVSLWHEASYRDRAGRYGLPDRPQETEHFTQRSWVRVGGIVTPFENNTMRLFLTAGAAEDTDVLSVFRLGGALWLRSELPLVLHGYNAGEVFARRFWLLNASYRLPPLPGLERVRLQLSGDYAGVDYFTGHRLPRRGLTGAAADITVALTEGATILLGYGYGFDAPRGHRFGGQEAHLLFEVKF